MAQLGVATDTEAMLSPDLPFRAARAQLNSVFPALAHNILIVVDGDSHDATRLASERIAERIRGQPDLFSSVYVPGGGPFFERNALLYLEIGELEEIADRLAMAQPLLADLSLNPSLAGLADTLRRGIQAAGEDGEQFEPAFEVIDTAFEGALEGRSSFSWEEWVLGDRAGSRRVILAQPRMDLGEFQPGAASLRAVRETVAQLAPDVRDGVRVRLTGSPALSHEELELVKQQAGWAGVASAVLVGFALLLALRSVYVALAVLGTLLIGLLWTAAFAALAIGHLNLISVTFAVLFIGLGVDFGIHFASRYLELRGTGCETNVALLDAAGDVGGSLTICAGTTSLGFYAFVPTDYLGVAELGLISGSGMFLCLIATLTILPALLCLRPRASPRLPVLRLASGFERLLRRPRAVLLGAVSVSALAAVALPHVRFDASPLGVRDPASESVRTMHELLAEADESPWTIDLLARDAAEAARASTRLKNLASVERVVTLPDYVPGQQAEKLEILEEIALLLGPLSEPRGPLVPADTRQSRAALSELEAELGNSSAMRQLPAAIRLRRTLGRIGRLSNDAAAWQVLEDRVIGDLPALLRRLLNALDARRIELEALPAELRTRYRAADGRMRVEVFPAVDLGNSAGLRLFVDEVQRVEPRATGPAVEIVESGRAIVGALWWALGTAFVLIAACLLALWRSTIDTALVLGPLLLAALWMAASGVALDVPFNFADVIVLPLLLGIGVDTGIHMIHSFRVHNVGPGELLRTSTARAVLFSSLTTIGSFGTLAFSTHRGMASPGQLLSLAIWLTVIANLVVLPALLALRTRPMLPDVPS